MRGGTVCICFKGSRNAHDLLGKTTSSQSDENLSIDVLVEDFCALLQTIYPDAAAAPTLMVKLILHYVYQLLTLKQLVGHSMGGSVCVRACPILQHHKYRIAGVAVLDVVEGTLTSP
jgi:protein phosphatase methylesterase 1